MVDFRINVIVDGRGAVTNITRIDNQFRRFERRLFSIYGLLGRFGGVLAAALTFRGIQAQVDGYLALQNRLAAVTKEGESLANVNRELLQIANRSRTSLQEVGRIYSRLAGSQKALGISTKELSDFTETLAKTISISGATSYEAQGALTQFSQALASGALRGDELRSVLEQLPQVANVIAERFGVTAPQLAVLGKQGLITSNQIIQAFRDAREEIEKRFAATVPTISQSLTILGNEVLVTFGRINRATAFSTGFNKIIVLIASNLGFLISQLELAAVAFNTAWGDGTSASQSLSYALNVLSTVIAGVFQGFVQGVQDALRFVGELTGSVVGLPLFEIREFLAAFVRVATVIVLLNSGLSLLLGLLGKLYAPVQRTLVILLVVKTLLVTTVGVVGSLARGFFAVLRTARILWALFGLFAPTLSTIVGFFARMAGWAGIILAGFKSLFSYLLGATVSFDDTWNIVTESLYTAFVQVTENISILFKKLVNAVSGFFDLLWGGVLSGAGTLYSAFQGLVATLASIKVISEERRIAFEDAGTQLNAFLNKNRGQAEPIFNQADLDKQSDALSSFLNAQDAKIQQFYVDIAARNVDETERAVREEAERAALAARMGGAEQQLGAAADIFGQRGAAPAGQRIPLPPQGLLGAGVGDVYAQSLESLKAIVFTEATRITQGEVLADQLAARYDIERQSGKLTEEQVAELDRFVQLSRDAQAVSSMVQQLDVQRQYLETERQLNLVLAARPDLIAQVNQAFVANKIAALDAQTTMSAGFERAFLKLGQEAQNYASVAESAVMTFADRSTEAIATFVETGQLNFKAFASSLLSDIARLIIRLLVLQAIQAAVGLVAPGATTAGVVAAAAGGAAGGGGGRARGGTVQPDRSYVVG